MGSLDSRKFLGEGVIVANFAILDWGEWSQL